MQEIPKHQPEEPRKKLEINPFRSVISKSSDNITRLFVNDLGVLEPNHVSQVEQNTKLLLVPGSSILVGIKAARKVDEQIVQTIDPESTPNAWKTTSVLRGITTELIAQGFRDKVLNESYIKLTPSLGVLLAIYAANPETPLINFAVLELLTLLTVPYSTYHEMMHGISDKKLTEKYGKKMNETLTDFWVRESTRTASDPISRYVSAYASLPFTSWIGWPSTFAREEIDFITESMTQKLGNRRNALRKLAQAYTGIGEQTNLSLSIDELTNGKGDQVIETVNSKIVTEEKLDQIKTYFS